MDNADSSSSPSSSSSTFNPNRVATKPTLTYFPTGGRAKVARLLLEDAGVDYDYVPLYEEPGLTLVQSGAIARHLGKKLGYAGASDHEAALIDAAYEGVSDIVNRFVAVLGLPAEQAKTETERLMKEYLPLQLGYLDKLLEKNGNNGFLVGGQLSYADAALFTMLQSAFRRPGADSLAAQFPALKAYHDGIQSRDRIKRFLATDPYGTSAPAPSSASTSSSDVKEKN
ncbi:glutathione Stransferase, C-terminal domain containing protein [Acanthamoeba castellanii str. Neff]|uniref:Glutathione Stransferase, C-terminal domain containing protein n=1 Tax=Acanthamoeba castellanii (strain ATCC 30010 / Neff) TaxID=1257118 RepID=L8GDT6_ACACF|nr:glutathione Stransferase, C-terminal domain containing protein [Acanthamoeba castellanii str. Neff]ELR10883.1 glutathione Stransferase, C-terminal domain containing protein [Acanthamoeba castellanii str. Neff]